MALYVSEFLYRGRDPDSGLPPAWHLQMGQTGVDAFGVPLPDGPVMNMSQAADAGYVLPEVIAAINVEILVENESLNALLAAVYAENAALEARLSALQNPVDQVTQEPPVPSEPDPVQKPAPHEGSDDPLPIEDGEV